jgi:hypothetical protein
MPICGGEKFRKGMERLCFFCTYFLYGLTTPFSDFFCAMVTVYGFHLLDFTPNAVACMAIFAHLCENFVGLAPMWTCSGTSSSHGWKINLIAWET